MDFEFTDDQLALRENARSVLSTSCPPSLVRAVYEGTDDAVDQQAKLWATLTDLGWPALGVAEEHGGLGLGPIEVGLVVEELGRAVAPTPFLATVTQLVPLLRESGSSLLLEEIAAGTTTGTLALAEGGSWRPADVATTAARSGDGWTVSGTKHHVMDGAAAEWIAVVARSEEGLGAFLVPGTDVSATPLQVMDPSWPLATVSLDGVSVPAGRVVVEPGDPRADEVLERALQEAVVAISLSTVATCRAVFETTLQYAKDREQFGKPIGSFQALKHRLADVYLAVERAYALACFAALTLAEDDDRRALAASMAKAAAGECQRLVARDGLQIHGGVGFTWEHDLHFGLKRAKTGDLLFGTAAAHRARVAELLGLVEGAA